MIQKFYDNDIEETILETSDFIERLEHSSTNYLKDLQKELEEYSYNHTKCYICGQDLETKTDYEVSEYQGFPCREEINELCCPEHGEIY